MPSASSTPSPGASVSLSGSIKAIIRLPKKSTRARIPPSSAAPPACGMASPGSSAAPRTSTWWFPRNPRRTGRKWTGWPGSSDAAGLQSGIPSSPGSRMAMRCTAFSSCSTCPTSPAPRRFLSALRPRQSGSRHRRSRSSRRSCCSPCCGTGISASSGARNWARAI